MRTRTLATGRARRSPFSLGPVWLSDSRLSVLQAVMGMMSLFGKLFGAHAAAPSDAMKLDGKTVAALGRSLSALPPDEPGWITFAEARSLFSTKDAEYAFGETDDDGRRNIESFAAQNRSAISFMPVEGRVYFVRDPTAVTS